MHGPDPVLRPIQRRIVEDVAGNAHSVILGARQIGKTQSIAYVAACYALGVHPVTGEPIEPDDVQIASMTARHSKDVLARTQRLVSQFGGGTSKVTDDKRTGSLRIKLATGREILSHSGDPNSLQGFSGHTIVDELGATPYDPDTVYTSSMSAASGHPDRRWLGSGNASKAGTWWHRLHTDQGEDWQRRRSALVMSRYTIHDVYPDGLPPHIEALRDALGGPNSAGWRRWFLCEWVEGYDRALTDAEIAGCRYATPDMGYDAETIIGVDPGGYPNPTGVCVVRVSDAGARVLLAEYWRTDEIGGDETKRAAWTSEQVARVFALAKRFRASRVVVDHSNLASHIGQAFVRRLGDMVTLVATTTQARQRRWGLYLSLIREGRLEIPGGCDDLYDDLRRCEVEAAVAKGARWSKTSEGGLLVLPQVPDGDHILHCDVLDALLLTAEARIA